MVFWYLIEISYFWWSTVYQVEVVTSKRNQNSEVMLFCQVLF